MKVYCKDCINFWGVEERWDEKGLCLIAETTKRKVKDYDTVKWVTIDRFKDLEGVSTTYGKWLVYSKALNSDGKCLYYKPKLLPKILAWFKSNKQPKDTP